MCLAISLARTQIIAIRQQNVPPNLIFRLLIAMHFECLYFPLCSTVLDLGSQFEALGGFLKNNISLITLSYKEYNILICYKNSPENDLEPTFSLF